MWNKTAIYEREWQFNVARSCPVSSCNQPAEEFPIVLLVAIRFVFTSYFAVPVMRLYDRGLMVFGCAMPAMTGDNEAGMDGLEMFEINCSPLRSKECTEVRRRSPLRAQPLEWRL